MNSRQQPLLSKLKVAIVHDWLYGGGAERVVYELHRLFPDAPIYTSYCSKAWRKKLDNKVITGYLQRWPFRSMRKFLPLLRQQWFGSLDLSSYDLVISSTGNGEAKFVSSRRFRNAAVRARQPIHICYCHTPTQFYWRHYNAYLENPGFRPQWLARLGLKLLVKPLRGRDYEAAQKVDYFIANSSHIKSDIKQFYHRDSVVVHPPVDLARFQKAAPKAAPKDRQAFLTVGRLVPYKRVDIIVKACSRLSLPLTVVGRGPELKKLVAMAGPSVTFDTNASDEGVVRYMAGAKAFLFAAHEDFGITPIEAMAAGTPVIAYKAGGALDYVIPGKTGVFFADQTVEALAATLQAFNPKNYASDDIKSAANQFSVENFHKNLTAVVSSVLQ